MDVGCGPFEAVDTLATLVSPSGQVIGLDKSASAVRYAEAILGTGTNGNIHWLVEDIHHTDIIRRQLENKLVDVAYCRFLLAHQTNPGETLAAIAALVRPSGYIVAHEWLDDPQYPKFEP